MSPKAKKKNWFSDSDIPVRVSGRMGLGPSIPDPCYHKEIEIMLVLRGEGIYWIKDHTYRFQQNSVLIVHSNEVHNYIANPQSFYDSTALLFAPSLIRKERLATDDAAPLVDSHQVLLTDKEATRMDFWLREIQEECNTQYLHWLTMVQNQIERILSLLDRADRRKSLPALTVSAKSQEIISYIDSHLSEKLTLTRVAGAVGYSPSVLSRMFKSYVGLNFQDYLIHRRIAEAKMLLQDTDFKIAAVARKSGFAEISTFNRNFKLLTGMAPLAYRKLFQQIAEAPVSIDTPSHETAQRAQS